MFIEKSGWGRNKFYKIKLSSLGSLEELKNEIFKNQNSIPAGSFRSYGDSALSENVLSSKKFNKIISFDQENGKIKVESGVRLKEIIELIVPKGWFLKITPGTKYVTIGGAIASDVHGKEHHIEGCFSNCLDYFEIMLADGKIYKCSENYNSELYKATCGGMGLTGFIISAQFNLKKIKSAFLDQEVSTFNQIENLINYFDNQKTKNYSVAWIDAKKKNNDYNSVFFSAEFKNDENYNLKLNKRRKINNFLKINLIHKYLINLFNIFFYLKHKLIRKKSIISIDNFFYPLDKVKNWNSLFGKRGFFQYQFIVPKNSGLKAILEILELINQNKIYPSLSVLKLHKESNDNYLSFPLEGYSLALDFYNQSNVDIFVKKMDKIIEKYDGRIYLTKDSYMTKEFFKKSYPKSIDFKNLRKKIKVDFKFSSFQSIKLDI